MEVPAEGEEEDAGEQDLRHPRHLGALYICLHRYVALVLTLSCVYSFNQASQLEGMQKSFTKIHMLHSSCEIIGPEKLAWASECCG